MANSKNNKNTNKKGNKNQVEEKKKVSPKVLIIIGAAIAVLALALFLIFNDGMPKNVKTAIEANVQHQIGCDISSLKTAKKFKIKDTEYDKETIYIIDGVLKGTEFANGNHAVILAAEIKVDGKERVICKLMESFPEKEEAKKLIDEMKKDPEGCSETLKRINENNYLDKKW